jgi:tetratricopeptide (TPR) repeat protein
MSVTTPLHSNALFELLSRFHPADTAAIVPHIRRLLQQDPGTRAACAPFVTVLESQEEPCGVTLFLEVSRQEARALWRESLEDLSPAELREAVLAPRGRILWGLAEELCIQSRKAAVRDPQHAEALATLAIDVARRAPLLPYITTESMRKELILFASASLGNAHRTGDRLAEARTLLRQAAADYPASNVLGFLPGIYSLQASLETDERRFEAALAKISRAFAAKPEPMQKVRLLLQQSVIWNYSGEPLDALAAIEEALALLSASNDAYLTYCCLQNQADLLSRLGRFEEAAVCLPELQERARDLQLEVPSLRLDWVAARVAAGQGDREHAEALFLQVREGFLAHAMPYEAAVATIEYARFLFQAGRLPEVAQLAITSASEFLRQGVEEELVAALGLLEGATRGHLTLAAIERLLSRFETAAIGRRG